MNHEYLQYQSFLKLYSIKTSDPFNPDKVHKDNKVSHRNHPLRILQNILAPSIPYILLVADRLGAFPDTNLHNTLQTDYRKLTADEITLAQLQLTTQVCKRIKTEKSFKNLGIRLLIISLLNGADGPIARRLHNESSIGGIKDASVDRLSEMLIADLIAEEIGLNKEKKEKLQVAFALSTLTKAACEMSDVATSEGGSGSMLERRKQLYYILNDILELNKLPIHEIHNRGIILNRVNDQIDSLIKNSFNISLKRAKSISKITALVKAPKDEHSPGATEAIKYAGVDYILFKSYEIHMSKVLSDLLPEQLTFPNFRNLYANHQYIRNALKDIQPFIDKELEIISQS